VKIFIEVPVWLGDTIMATPAVKNIISSSPKAKITIFGSFVATEIYKNFPHIEKIVIDESKKKGNRFLNLKKIASSLGSFDIAISFRRSFSSKFLLFFLKAKKKYSYHRLSREKIHLVKRYNDFINKSLHLNNSPMDLELFIPKKSYHGDKKLLGLNAGATYGSAKRWYPNEFASVATTLSKDYDIVIFGGKNELDIAYDIEKILNQNSVNNYKNLAGKTSIKELCENISMLDLLVTNDSGPMHIASAYKIKTITIFGPTMELETNGWNNPNEIILRKPMKCAPCMKRECPFGHHECMKSIKASDVLEKV
jgi:heptosyltransferase-2